MSKVKPRGNSDTEYTVVVVLDGETAQRFKDLQSGLSPLGIKATKSSVVRALIDMKWEEVFGGKR